MIRRTQDSLFFVPSKLGLTLFGLHHTIHFLRCCSDLAIGRRWLALSAPHRAVRTTQHEPTYLPYPLVNFHAATRLAAGSSSFDPLRFAFVT